MWTRIALAMVVVLCLCGTTFGATSLPERYQPNAITIKLQPRTSLQKIPQADGTVRTGLAALDQLGDKYRLVKLDNVFPDALRRPQSEDYVGLRDWVYLEFDGDIDMAAVLAEYGALSEVVRVTPIGYYDIEEVFPNDPNFADQWFLYQDDNDHHIHAPSGWDFETGDSLAIFGCMDTGVLWNHPDLIDAIWVNPGEDLDGDGVVWDTDDLNGIDDDGNGKIDDIIGWDFVEAGSTYWPGEDFSFEDNDPADFNGHGTHVGGLAAGVRNNLTGGCGVAGGNERFGARIMPLRIGWSYNDGGVERGQVSMLYAARAFDYAVDKGVDVINCSWGNHDDAGFGDAVANALANGVVITNSAGNGGDDSPDYMGLIPEIISVAATKSNDVRASYTDFGTWVTVSAPGGDFPDYMCSTYSDHYTPTYASIAGTSMAAPVVAGLALLLKSHHPEYDRDDIFPLIVNNTDNIDAENPGYIGKLGTGRINVYNTLSGLTSADFTTDTSYGHPPLTVTFTDNSINVTGDQWYFFGDGDSAAGPNAVHTYTEPGFFDVFYRADGPSGFHTRRKYQYIIGLKDTLWFGSIDIFQGEDKAMPVYLSNSMPVDSIIFPLVKEPWWPSGVLKYDSVTLGDRTSYFERLQVVYSWSAGGQLAVRMFADNGGGSPALEPGSGIVAYLWFHTDLSAPLGYQEVCDSGQAGDYNLLVETPYVDFKPEFKSATVTVIGGLLGDANYDSAINPVDVVLFVNFVYKSIGYIPLYNGDVNCDGSLNPLDVVYMVNFVYKGIGLPYPGGCP